MPPLHRINAYAEDIIALYECGHSAYEIAKTWGVDNQVVYALLKRNGIEMRPWCCRTTSRGSLPAMSKLDAHASEVVSMYERGYTVTEIARHFGVVWGTVDRFMKMRKIKKLEIFPGVSHNGVASGRVSGRR
jgi:transposase